MRFGVLGYWVTELSCDFSSKGNEGTEEMEESTGCPTDPPHRDLWGSDELH